VDSTAPAPSRPAMIPLSDVAGLLDHVGDVLAATSDADLARIRSWIAAKLIVSSLSIESHLSAVPSPAGLVVEADPAEWPSWCDNWHYADGPAA